MKTISNSQRTIYLTYFCKTEQTCHKIDNYYAGQEGIKPYTKLLLLLLKLKKNSFQGQKS